MNETRNKNERISGGFTISHSQLVNMLRRDGFLSKSIPADAVRIFIAVPDGGDYSGVELDISGGPSSGDGEVPLEISYQFDREI